jgi:hypothetical protein
LFFDFAGDLTAAAFAFSHRLKFTALAPS